MNEYIKNSTEIKAIANGKNDEGLRYDIGVALDIYDKRHGLKYDIKRRAEYKQSLGVTLSVPEMRVLEGE